MKYTIEIEWKYDYILRDILLKEMKRLWSESLIMANPSIKVSKKYDVYWAEKIDQVADILIQIDNNAELPKHYISNKL